MLRIPRWPCILTQLGAYLLDGDIRLRAGYKRFEDYNHVMVFFNGGLRLQGKDSSLYSHIVSSETISPIFLVKLKKGFKNNCEKVPMCYLISQRGAPPPFLASQHANHSHTCPI